MWPVGNMMGPVNCFVFAVQTLLGNSAVRARWIANLRCIRLIAIVVGMAGLLLSLAGLSIFRIISESLFSISLQSPRSNYIWLYDISPPLYQIDFLLASILFSLDYR